MPSLNESTTMPSSLPSAGIYLHWPFCERKCPYCDFYTFGREHPFHAHAAPYLQALLAEIESAPARFGWSAPPRIDSIYFGGGTPSLMGPEALAALMRVLNHIFNVDPSSEITLEVNPTTAETAALDRVLALGVNRLSVGCQSFNDRILARLGRVHDAATTRRAIAAMRALGVKNLSLDLIFGAPTQTLTDFENDLAEILRFSPEHISAYNMTVHEGTPFARWQREGRLDLADEEVQAEMFERLIDTLAAAGYGHYEISNWSRPGLASRHNSKYWRAGDVLGFGVSAHGIWRGRRHANPRDLKSYIDLETRALAEPLPEPASERACRGEIMMLVLRRVEGVGWDEIEQWMRCDPREAYRPEFERLSGDGLIEMDEHRLRLTRRGILLSDSVMEEFF